MTLRKQSRNGLGAAELAICALAAVALSRILLAQNLEPGAVFYVWPILILLLFIPQTGAGAIYVATALFLIVPSLRQGNNQNAAGSLFAEEGDGAALVYACSVVLWLATSLRMVDLMGPFRRSLKSSPDTPPDPEPSSWTRPPSAARAGYVLLPAGMILAMGLLSLMPENPFSRELYRLTSGGHRAIKFIWFLGMGWIVASTISGIVEWIRSDRHQASMYVRKAFVEEALSELAAIEKRR